MAKFSGGNRASSGAISRGGEYTSSSRRSKFEADIAVDDAAAAAAAADDAVSPVAIVLVELVTAGV